jgi:hypothetical protein
VASLKYAIVVIEWVPIPFVVSFKYAIAVVGWVPIPFVVSFEYAIAVIEYEVDSKQRLNSFRGFVGARPDNSNGYARRLIMHRLI